MAISAIKVLVVDDSAFMRLLISDILNADKDLEVIDTASDGKIAIEKTRDLQPDVVVLDMNMGNHDGLHAIRGIMKARPTPILILSSVGNSSLEPIFEGLNLGAVDYLNKPDTKQKNLRQISNEIIKKTKQVSNANLASLLRQRKKENLNPHVFSKELNYDIIAIGSSTGGPTAVEEVIKNLPSNLTVPVLIVQHMPENFIPAFVARLDKITSLKVMVGSPNIKPAAGMIIVAPAHTNMIISDQKTKKIAFTDEVFKDFNNPSVNAMMLSVAKQYGGRTIGVILTGMGKDGALGLKAIKDAGGHTIGQSKETCTIFGMPKAAGDIGAVDKFVPLKEIAGYIVTCLS